MNKVQRAERSQRVIDWRNQIETNLSTPLTEPQLDLLKMFSHKVDDADWLAIKRMIVHYFAQKAIDGANQVWDEQGWDDQK